MVESCQLANYVCNCMYSSKLWIIEEHLEKLVSKSASMALTERSKTLVNGLVLPLQIRPLLIDYSTRPPETGFCNRPKKKSNSLKRFQKKFVFWCPHRFIQELNAAPVRSFLFRSSSWELSAIRHPCWKYFPTGCLLPPPEYFRNVSLLNLSEVFQGGGEVQCARYCSPCSFQETGGRRLCFVP